MKRLIIKFPATKAGEVADIIGENGFVNLVSWVEGDGLFDSKIKMHLAVPADKADFAQVKFGTYIQKS